MYLVGDRVRLLSRELGEMMLHEHLCVGDTGTVVGVAYEHVLGEYYITILFDRLNCYQLIYESELNDFIELANKVKIKYLDSSAPKLENIGGEYKSNWVDVRASRIEVNGIVRSWGNGLIGYKKGDVLKIYLGFAMELPVGMEAYTLPRGSNYKHYRLIQTNSKGVVDTSYCGDNDEWFIPCIALEDGLIERYDRVGQIRLHDVMRPVVFDEVTTLGNADRGGHGSTGKE